MPMFLCHIVYLQRMFFSLSPSLSSRETRKRMQKKICERNKQTGKSCRANSVLNKFKINYSLFEIRWTIRLHSLFKSIYYIFFSFCSSLLSLWRFLLLFIFILCFNNEKPRLSSLLLMHLLVYAAKNKRQNTSEALVKSAFFYAGESKYNITNLFLIRWMWSKIKDFREKKKT